MMVGEIVNTNNKLILYHLYVSNSLNMLVIECDNSTRIYCWIYIL